MRTQAEYVEGKQTSMIFNTDTANDRSMITKYFSTKIKAPWVHVEVSTLGGASRASVIIKISLDSKKSWHNGILQNSRYAMFHLGRDGVLEQFAKSYQISKMRKSRVKTATEAVVKINKYIKQNM